MSRKKDLSALREDALAIFQVGLNAVDPKAAVRRFLRLERDVLTIGEQSYDLSSFENIYAVGAGKASAAMAQAIEAILGDRLKAGVINVKDGHAVPLRTVRVNEAAHPVPNEAGIEGTKEIIELLRRSGERDLIICLLSGGGSALLPCPSPGLSLNDKQQTTQLLLDCGATIHEINAVRKHISAIKGGRLARFAYPSRVVSLILSDVIGDDLDIIASGPTVPDRSTFSDCLRFLEKYSLVDKVPETVRQTLVKGAQGKVVETPGEDDPAFQLTQTEIIGSNILAVRAAARKSRELGYNSLILSTMIEGETRDVAKVHAAIAKEVLRTGNPIQRPACLVSGGETTVTIRGDGLGGRNQEFALAAAMDITDLDDTIILSGGTDGTDGPTDAAGAIVDSETIQTAQRLGLDANQYLEQNDSYHFFQRTGDLIITGPTLTNVMDLRLILVG